VLREAYLLCYLSLYFLITTSAYLSFTTFLILPPQPLDYFKGEINAWEVTLSTEWETQCSLKVLPNWKDLGKRLGESRVQDTAPHHTTLRHATRKLRHENERRQLPLDHTLVDRRIDRLI
jgi:hypothetical protein